MHENGLKSGTFWPDMTPADAPYQIHSQARGSHWIAWISQSGDLKPHRSVVLIAAAKEEAEARARQWADRAVSAHADPGT